MLKLSSQCFSMRPLLCPASTEFFKAMYFASFHSVIWYNFLGKHNSNKQLLPQKKKIRIMASAQRTKMYKDLFKIFCILTLTAKYIFALMAFTVDKFILFKLNLELFNVNTRHKLYLHRPTAILVYQKVVYCARIKFQIKHTVRNYELHLIT
jgi:hypothetical protein